MIYNGDCADVMELVVPDNSIQACVTSPPYWGLRDYGMAGQLGAEESPELYVENMVKVFREVRRCLKPDGTLWLNLGDSYYNYRPGRGQRQSKQSIASQKFSEVDVCNKRGLRIDGLKEKDLVGIPWRVAFALQADGWYLRSDIIWHKPNPMPESVTDRPTKAHEYIFLMTKSKDYYYDAEAIKEPAVSDFRNREKANGESAVDTKIRGSDGCCGVKSDKRNKRSVWTVTTKPYKGAHFATFPMDLIEPCILAGSKKGDTILDPFNGSGTVGACAYKHSREYVGIELNPEYIKLSEDRISATQRNLV